jgi:hypothetical protein
MNWQTTYPTLAQVNEAAFQTLDTWAEKLPPPQTDVEKTVMRRLLATRDKLCAQETRKADPALADKLKDLGQRLGKMGIANPFEKF